MCHSLGPLARGPPFIQLAFYSNTSTPPPVHWDQAQLRPEHRSPTQNSMQSSRTSDWKGVKERGCGSQQSKLASETNEPSQPEKASPSASDKSSRTHRGRSRRSQSVGRGHPVSLPGPGRDRLLLPSLGAGELRPLPQGRTLSSPLL